MHFSDFSFIIYSQSKCTCPYMCKKTHFSRNFVLRWRLALICFRSRRIGNHELPSRRKSRDRDWKRRKIFKQQKYLAYRRFKQVNVCNFHIYVIFPSWRQPSHPIYLTNSIYAYYKAE